MKRLVLILLLAASVAQAETYKWTDQEGTVHFADTLGAVPAEQRNSARPHGMYAGPPSDRSMSLTFAESRPSGSVTPAVDELKERMMKDEVTMALIASLVNDPDIQAILADPSIVRAVQSGDVGALEKNPDFMKLLNNSRVRAIENRMQSGGTR